MGKTAIQMRNALRLDLKDSGALWSDAELNRSIQRAFSDLSRFIPDEKIYEDSLQFEVTGESVTFPADTSINAIVAAEDISAAVSGATATIDGQPDVPRPLQITITDTNDSITGLTLIVDGIGKDDQALQEIFHFTRGDDKVWSGKKYFKAVYQIEIDQITDNGAADVLDIGYATYTDVWVYLANSPIKWASETATDSAGSDIVRNTDFYIDYATGRVKAIASAKISAAEVCTFAYTKSQIGIDISSLANVIRVQRVEYPVGSIPQNFAQFDVFGKWVVVTGSGESDEQALLAEDKQFRIYYDAKHQAPGEYSPSSASEFLEDTVILAAGAYALYMFSLKQGHQAVTDLTSARTSLTSANTAHTAMGTALTNLIKYLNANTEADAAGILKDITDDVASLRTAITTAADALNTYLDAVATDLTNADAVRAKYMGATANYVDGGVAPDIKKYLDDGDAILNTVAVGGEGQEVPRAYREYAQTVKESLVLAHEQDRRFYQQNATARTNAAMVYANEAAQRLSNIRTYLEQSAGYVAISNTFATEAGHRAGEIMSYLQQARQYVEAANTDISLANRFKLDADERRNEVYSIWRDRRQYIGDFTAGAMRQMPSY